MNRASADGKFELRLVQCDGTCHLAPLVRHQGRYVGPLSSAKPIEFARGLIAGDEGSGKKEEAAPQEVTSGG